MGLLVGRIKSVVPPPSCNELSYDSQYMSTVIVSLNCTAACIARLATLVFGVDPAKAVSLPAISVGELPFAFALI